jgi:hypothetical protein
LSTDFIYAKFGRQNLKVSQCCHICNCSLSNTSYRICRYTYDLSPYQFHTSSFNGSLVITTKPKNYIQTLCSCHVVLHSTTRTKTLIKVAYFSKIYFYTSFQYSKLHGTSVTSTSQVCASIMLLLLAVGESNTAQLECPPII